jgi:hypothetical protein
VLVVVSLLQSLPFLVRSRASHIEILALRHQLAIANRARHPRVRLTAIDRVLWVWLSHRWRGWRSALHIVQPATVLAWHRRGFRLFWTWKSRHRTGRPAVPHDIKLRMEYASGWDCDPALDVGLPTTRPGAGVAALAHAIVTAAAAIRMRNENQ